MSDGSAATDGGLVARLTAVLDVPPVRLARHATVVVAVSGGRDSVALLHLVAAARPDLDLVVGHVRHGLREDAADAAAARANARAVGVAHLERAVRVGEGRGPEDAARTARYAALRAIADEVGAVAVLVGHTMDDQAETVLIRIARGTGVPGLAGMDVVTNVHGVPVIRPLLAERRADVRAAAVGHPTVEDPTNADPDQRRARARREALPALARLHPAEGDVVPLLARLAGFARPHRDCSASGGPLGDVRAGGGQVTARPLRFGMAVDVTGLGGPAPGALDEGLRAAWERLPEAPPWPGSGVARTVMALAVGRSVDLPGGVRVTRLAGETASSPPGTAVTTAAGGWEADGDRVVLVRVDTPALPSTPLAEGASTAVPGFGLLRWDRAVGEPADTGVDGGALTRPAWRGWSWSVEVAGEHPPLVVRGRADDGDRAARRVLQTFPVPLRRQVPLVLDASGRLLMAGPVVLVPPRSGGPAIRLAASPGAVAGRPVGYPPRA